MKFILFSIILLFPAVGYGQGQGFLIDSTYMNTAQGKYMGSAWELFLANSNEDALEYLDKAIEIDSTYKEPWLVRFYIYSEKLYDQTEAIYSISKLIEIDPDNPNFRVLRATAKEDYEDYYGALADVNYLLERDPDFADLYYFKGRIYTELRNYNKAIINLDKALELNTSKKDEALMLRGRAYMLSEKYQGAVKDFDRVSKLDSKHTSEAQLLKGYSLVKAGKEEEGCIELSKSLDKGHPDALRHIKTLCN